MEMAVEKKSKDTQQKQQSILKKGDSGSVVGSAQSAGRMRRIASISTPLQEGEAHVNVAVRCRPISKKEVADAFDESMIEIESSTKIVVHNPSETPSDLLGTRSGERQNFSRVYEFDAVFGPSASQKLVYDTSGARRIVSSVLEGFNGTIFAYGQTGTGKTYTMQGRSKNRTAATTAANSSGENKETDNAKSDDDDDDAEAGIMSRAFKQIFDHIEANKSVQFVVRASYLEIYKEQIYDLLRNERSKKLELREQPISGTVYVEDLTSLACESIADVERVTAIGNKNRSVAATDMNEHSSRSHAILVLEIEQQHSVDGNDADINNTANIAVDAMPMQKQRKQTNNKSQSNNVSTSTSTPTSNSTQTTTTLRVGKLNFVDLAGSERQSKTNSSGERQKESIKINLSLSVLGSVINSLMKLHSSPADASNSLDSKPTLPGKSAGDTNKNKGGSSSQRFIAPYRDSKLTRLLQDSLGGNSKTLMIANIGPASYNYDETIVTLNYASRAKCIRNKPRLNENSQGSLLRELQAEISYLRAQLAARVTSQGAQVHGQRQATSEARGQADSAELAAGVDASAVELELDSIRSKLQVLEAKLLNGKPEAEQVDHAKLLAGYTNDQKVELERRHALIESHISVERVIRNQIKEFEETEMNARKLFTSTQSQVDAKRETLRQLVAKVKQQHQQLDDQQQAFRIELDELEQLQYVLQKELKLKSLIVNNFIPKQTLDTILSKLSFDEKRNICVFDTSRREKLSNCDPELILDFESLWPSLNEDGSVNRLRTSFEKTGAALEPGSARFKRDNLIEPRIVVPTKTNFRQFVPQAQESLIDDSSFERDLEKLIDAELNKHEPDIIIYFAANCCYLLLTSCCLPLAISFLASQSYVFCS